MTEKSDTIIIGGGIIGLMTARELARRGRSVTVLDRGQLGAQASGAAGGILCPLYPWRLPLALQSLAAQSMREFPQVVAELTGSSGCAIGLRRTGLLVLDHDELDLARQWAEQWSIEYESLSARQLQAIEPELAVDGEGLCFPRMRNVYSRDLIRALAAEAPSLGIHIHPSLAVEDLRLEVGEAAVKTAQGWMQAEQLVIAGGAWSGLLLERLGAVLPLRPVRGQVIQFPAGSSALRHMVLKGRKYLVPRPGGELIVGSTLEEAGFDAEPTETGQRVLHEAATAMVPGLSQKPVEDHWAGLRPAAPDGLPFIGAWPEPGRAAIHLNTGHYQNGILLAPLSGRLLAQQMCGEVPEQDLAPFRPGRERIVE
ncbi:glycine oxidase [Natronospira proteinivora]|uniref:Glycine oxidase n=1 Tax=Natronospira proteinivora TaxID=1807133 RepID=A0ABT1G4K8_9GAMM|nr:glycine oxidase ThiO [Natronospira proteinivora]MCP1726225.1 glycine oxidase [Natronospira proteinivora]